MSIRNETVITFTSHTSKSFALTCFAVIKPHRKVGNELVAVTSQGVFRSADLYGGGEGGSGGRNEIAIFNFRSPIHFANKEKSVEKLLLHLTF